MKREFPYLWAKASTLLATPVIILVAVIYIAKVASTPINQAFQYCITAIGIAAALSAICFSAINESRSNVSSSVMKYAAEKFLHSCLLLIQVLFLLFARDALSTWSVVTRSALARSIILYVFLVCILFVASSAAFCFYWALSQLNSELWSSWEIRIREMNRDKNGGKQE